MTQKQAIEIIKNMNDGYTFQDCLVCGNFNEQHSCCDKRKCDYLKAIDIVLNMIDNRYSQTQDIKHYEIKRIGRLSLCYKTFIHRKSKDDEIEICIWDEDFQSRYVIASFDENEKEGYYTLNSCADRLDNEKINWSDFGELVLEGYRYLESL